MKPTLSWLKENSEKYTWELTDAVNFNARDPEFLKRVEAVQEDGVFIRKVTIKQTNSIRLGKSWLTWPKAKNVSFKVTTPQGEFNPKELVVKIEDLTYCLRLIEDEGKKEEKEV